MEPIATRIGNDVASCQSPQLRRRSFVGAADLAVEAAEAPEARRVRDLIDREGRFVEQFFREVHTTRERDVERRRAEMLQEETPKMAARDADPIGQPLHPAVIQSTLGDQPERAGYERGGAEPGGRAGRGFRPAAKAWAESRRFGGGGGRKIPDVFVLWRACRTNWTAIDTGAGDGDEEAAVEARVPRSARAVACALIQFHACQPAMKVRLHPGRTPPRSVRRA